MRELKEVKTGWIDKEGKIEGDREFMDIGRIDIGIIVGYGDLERGL